MTTDSAGSNDSKYRWLFWTLMVFIIVPIVAAAAVILLVGLPLGTVWIMNSSNCCLADGPENMLTFWASMMAGFLALFGMVVTAVFIITAFRIDATARDKAQIAARDEVWTYIRNYRKKLNEDLCNLESLVGELTEDVKKCAGEAKDAFSEAQKDVEKEQRAAITAIAKALEDVQAQQREASTAILGARDATTNAATQAQEGIAKALEDVETRQRDASSTIVAARDATTDAASQAQEAINRARQEAEAAAREMRERADRGPEGPTPAGDDPDQT